MKKIIQGLNKNFFLLWTGQFVSQIGDKFYAIAMAWWILNRTDSPLMMGMYMLFSMLPGLLVGPFAGGLVDRWDRKKIIVFSDVLRGGIVVSVAILEWLNMLTIGYVFISAAWISIGSSFFDPTVKAVIPQIVEDEEMARANAYSESVTGLATILGPVLGAVLVSMAGFKWVFLANGLSYLISAFSESFMKIPPAAAASQQHSFMEHVKEGLVFVKNHGKISTIILVIAVAHFFIGSLQVAMPFLAKQLSGNGIKNLSYMEMMIGLGFILGSFIIGMKGQKKDMDKIIFMSIGTIGISFGAIALLKQNAVMSVIPYLLFVFCVGMSILHASVYWRTLLQKYTPTEIAGRVFSVASLVGNISLPLAFGFFGILLKRYPLAKVMLICGISLIIISYMLSVKWERERSAI